MRPALEHLLGLPTPAALALLTSYGITDVQVVPTAAPPRKRPSPDEERRSPQGEAEGYASTRVVGLRNDGHTLLVSRFLTAVKEENPPCPE